MSSWEKLLGQKIVSHDRVQKRIYFCAKVYETEDVEWQFEVNLQMKHHDIMLSQQQVIDS